MERLNFCESAPCKAEVYISDSEYEQLLDDLLQFEMNAYNTSKIYPSDDDKEYLDYLKYGWMRDLLFNAKAKP